MWTVNGQRPVAWRRKSTFDALSRADVQPGMTRERSGSSDTLTASFLPSKIESCTYPRLPRPLRQRVACLHHLRAGRPIGCTRPGTGSTRRNLTLHGGSDRGGVALERARAKMMLMPFPRMHCGRPGMPRERSSNTSQSLPHQDRVLHDPSTPPGTGSRWHATARVTGHRSHVLPPTHRVPAALAPFPLREKAGKKADHPKCIDGVSRWMHCAAGIALRRTLEHSSIRQARSRALTVRITRTGDVRGALRR
jgi:hypothetical protein